MQITPSVAAGNGPDESAFSVTVGAATGAASTTTMLSVATQPMILGDPGSFNVNVAPGAGVTGTVTLWDAVGPRSSPVTISGPAVNFQLEWTQAGSFSVYAVYSGDATHATSSSATRSFTVQPGVPQVTLTVEGPTGALSQTSLLANVSGNLKSGTLASPTGIVEYWDAVNGGAPQLLATLQLTPGAAGASVAGTRVKLGSGTHSLHVHYRGDNNWHAEDSANATASSFSLSASPNPLSFKGGTAGTATITVTPSGGFTGAVNLSCPAGGALALAGYTCSFSPAQVNVSSASPQSAMMTLTPAVTVTAAVSTEIPRATFWGGVGLWFVVLAAGIFAAWMARSLIQVPGRASAFAWSRGCAALAASLVIGCGGGGGGGGTGGGGPAATTTTLTVQQAGTQMRVSIVVKSSAGTPTGTVSLVTDGGAPMTGTISAGAANFNFTPSPAIGIHTLDAHYAGDAQDSASDSGQQNMVMTGSTMIEVTGTSGTISVPVGLAVVVN